MGKIIERKEERRIPFKDIPIGHFFMYLGELYIKIIPRNLTGYDILSTCCYHEKDFSYAVCLVGTTTTPGVQVSFIEECKVRPLEDVDFVLKD